MVAVGTAAVAVGVAATPEAEPDVCVIVNAANPVPSMTRAQVSRYFLKETVKWPDGSTVEPIDLAPTSQVRARFSKTVLGRSVKAMEAYWHRKVFQGEAVPPVFTTSEEDAVEFVRYNAKAIGYVSTAVARGKDVKIVPVVD